MIVRARLTVIAARQDKVAAPLELMPHLVQDLARAICPSSTPARLGRELRKRVPVAEGRQDKWRRTFRCRGLSWRRRLPGLLHRGAPRSRSLLRSGQPELLPLRVSV
eukprot:scaffold207_cov409-Prasinococcus_capsulatus_cf.AAC.99